MTFFKNIMLAAAFIVLIIPSASFAAPGSSNTNLRTYNQTTSVYERLSTVNRFNNLPKIWENGWVKDGYVVSTNAPYAIASFTVFTKKEFVAKQNTFIIHSNVKNIGEYLYNVEVVVFEPKIHEGEPQRYPVKVTKNGVATINGDVILKPGRYDIYVISEFKETIPQNTVLHTELENSRIKIGGTTFSTNMFGRSLPLQTVFVKY